MPAQGVEAAVRWRGWRSSAFVAVLLIAVASGCSDPEPGVVPRPDGESPTSAASPDLSDADLWLDFEVPSQTLEGDTEYPDALGGAFGGRVVTANGGTIEVVPGVDDAGEAVAFPEKCVAATECPRAMVEILPHPALDVGRSDFEFGAAVWLAPDQATPGSNIMQKGRFATDGGLWKLQVDSEEGQPSCVVRSGEDEPVIARSSASITDSTWHRVVCRRDATGVSIRVDDMVDREDGATGSVDSEWPVRIGSPGVGDQDDQFHGRIDDVFLRVDPPA